MTNEQINLLHNVADRVHGIAQAYAIDSPVKQAQVYRVIRDLVEATALLLEVNE